MAYLELKGVSKSFGEFQALRNISVSITKGGITAVLGENGAGKTTLMNVLYGLYRPDAGEISVAGKSLVLRSPKDAISHRIGMIHQHFHLARALTVTENILIGAGPALTGIKLRESEHAIAKLSKEFDFDVDPAAPVWKLSMGMQQRAEILKALYRKAELLILDEPTSVLAPDEISALLRSLSRLREAGTTILFVTHKLDEVFASADRVLVMRQGQLVADVLARETTQAQLSRTMVGRDLEAWAPHTRAAASGPVRLAVQGLRARNDRGAVALDNVTFDLKAGEVLGITGVDGNGQRELADVLAGLRRSDAGSIQAGTADITRASVRDRIHLHRLGFVPEDRHRTGLVLDHPVWMGFFLRAFYKAPVARLGLLHRRSMRARGGELATQYDCRLRSIDQPVSQLSGGNQQKVILARELEAAPAMLVVMQATKGLDIGAIEFVQNKIIEQRASGVAILYISTELEHVLQVADRVAVMYRGRLSEPVSRDRVTSEALGLLMSGARSGPTQ